MPPKLCSTDFCLSLLTYFWLSECDGSKVDTRERDEVCRFLGLIFPKVTSLSGSGASPEEIMLSAVFMDDFLL